MLMGQPGENNFDKAFFFRYGFFFIMIFFLLWYFFAALMPEETATNRARILTKHMVRGIKIETFSKFNNYRKIDKDFLAGILNAVSSSSSHEILFITFEI